MIKVDRKSVGEPAEFTRRAVSATKTLRLHVVRGETFRKQNQLPLNEELLAAPDLMDALQGLFRGCCAFCETPLLDSEKKFAAHFRPRQRASQLGGKVDPLHYWWLTYAWSNLYSICNSCQSIRGTRFPVRGKRAALGSNTGIKSERALLLDPCAEDPEAVLVFTDDGLVSSTSERGNTTIDVFGLNRASLVQARRDHCRRVDEIGDLFLDRNQPEQWDEQKFIAAVMGETPPEWGFRALTRQHARRHLENARSASRKLAPSAPYVAAEVKREYQGAVWLRRIEIDNYRVLRHLELQFPSRQEAMAAGNAANPLLTQTSQSAPAGEPWLMLLGENGVGKSSVLKAIALAMMPTSQLRRFGGDIADWVTRGSRSQSGMIRLEFTVGAQPLELHFSAKTGRVVRKGDFPNMAVLGYGATRLLPRPEDRAPRPERVRVQNLFDARAPLRDAEPWIADMRRVSGKNFNLLAQSLKLLLMMDENDRLVRREGRLSASMHRRQVPIRWLSDGYQSVLALALDMMRNLSARSSFDMQAVEGVVLVDEIETHLHPRWKIAIIGALRQLFPRVRFIATTHDPLCVQGLRKGELHVMTRSAKDDEVAIEQVDVRPGLRADQILTGEWFGVPSTRDPETVGMIAQHSELLQLRDRTPDQQAKLDALDEELRLRLDEYVGTRDQQIALRAAADFRAERGAGEGREAPLPVQALREKILAALRGAGG